ncbi:MAG: MarR family transcriptional regulator [Acetobacteraceae bacterium]|jgi:DNA-binding MarR family transcriptional regulator
MHGPSASPVRRTLGFLLRDTSRLMRRRFVQRSREVGLPINRSEASVLVHVDREPGMSQAQLAEQMDLEAISLVRLIDSLQAAGLIERRPHAHDRRIRTLWLTEAAQPILAQVRAVAEDVRAQAFVGIPAAEREVLLDLLVSVRSNLATQSGLCADAKMRHGDSEPPPRAIARSDARDGPDSDRPRGTERSR